MKQGSAKGNIWLATAAAFGTVAVLAFLPPGQNQPVNQRFMSMKPSRLCLEHGDPDQAPFSLVWLQENGCRPAVNRFESGGAAPYPVLPSDVAFSLAFSSAQTPPQVEIPLPGPGQTISRQIGDYTLFLQTEVVDQGVPTRIPPARFPAGPARPGEMLQFPGPQLVDRIPNQGRLGEQHMIMRSGHELAESVFWWKTRSPRALVPPPFRIGYSARFRRTDSRADPVAIHSALVVPLGRATPAIFTATPLSAAGKAAGSPVTLNPLDDFSGAAVLRIPACYNDRTSKMRIEARSTINPAQTAAWTVAGIPSVPKQFDAAAARPIALAGGVRIEAHAALSSDLSGAEQIGGVKLERKVNGWTLADPECVDSHDRTGVPAIRCEVQATGPSAGGADWYCDIDSMRPRWSASSAFSGRGSCLLFPKFGSPEGRLSSYGCDTEMAGVFSGQSQAVRITGTAGLAHRRIEFVKLRIRPLPSDSAANPVVQWDGPQSVTTPSGARVTALFLRSPHAAPEPYFRPAGNLASAYVAVTFPQTMDQTVSSTTLACFRLGNGAYLSPPSPASQSSRIGDSSNFAAAPQIRAGGTRTARAPQAPAGFDGVVYRLQAPAGTLSPHSGSRTATITIAVAYSTVSSAPFQLTVPVEPRFPAGFNPDDYDPRSRTISYPELKRRNAPAINSTITTKKPKPKTKLSQLKPPAT